MSAGGAIGQAVRSGDRRLLLVLASSAVFFSVLHHADHVVRGTHSGWPFGPEVTPFTYSLLIYALVLPGIYQTARGRDVAGYHLFVALGGLALLGAVHFVPVGGHEAPIGDIYMVYEGQLAGMLALGILAGLMVSVAALAAVALRAVLARLRTEDRGRAVLQAKVRVAVPPPTETPAGRGRSTWTAVCPAPEELAPQMLRGGSMQSMTSATETVSVGTRPVPAVGRGRSRARNAGERARREERSLGSWE